MAGYNKNSSVVWLGWNRAETAGWTACTDRAECACLLAQLSTPPMSFLTCSDHMQIHTIESGLTCHTFTTAHMSHFHHIICGESVTCETWFNCIQLILWISCMWNCMDLRIVWICVLWSHWVISNWLDQCNSLFIFPTDLINVTHSLFV